MTCFQLLEDARLDFLDPPTFVFLGLAQALNLGGEPLFSLCPLLLFCSSLTTSFFQRAQADIGVRNRIQMLLLRYAKGLDLGVELLLFAGTLRSSGFYLPANRFQFSQALLFLSGALLRCFFQAPAIRFRGSPICFRFSFLSGSLHFSAALLKLQLGLPQSRFLLAQVVPLTERRFFF